MWIFTKLFSKKHKIYGVLSSCVSFFLDYDILDFCVLQTAVNIMFVLFRAFLKSNNLDRRKFNQELISFSVKELKKLQHTTVKV